MVTKKNIRITNLKNYITEHNISVDEVLDTVDRQEVIANIQLSKEEINSIINDWSTNDKKSWIFGVIDKDELFDFLNDCKDFDLLSSVYEKSSDKVFDVFVEKYKKKYNFLEISYNLYGMESGLHITILEKVLTESLKTVGINKVISLLKSL